MLGVPRIGRRHELKFALESCWSGKSSEAELLEQAKALRAANWIEQRDRGVTKIPSNDFSLYDHSSGQKTPHTPRRIIQP
jgi:5-methyltetrahydropteroyltriglutamate--homocysteine methyltransferase